MGIRDFITKAGLALKIKSPELSRGSSRRRGTRGEQSGQDGYILLAVLFMVVMVLILLSLAAPKVAADIERDREVEMIHRGKQYVRAIKLYYKKFGAYPPNMDALEKTNEIRFLRKRYRDPITGKDEWHLIHFGENKTPSYGFFGQPLSGTGGSTVAGVGPGGVGSSLAPSTFGGSPAGGSSFGGSTLGGGSVGGSSLGGSSLGGSSIGGSSLGGTSSNGSAGGSGTSGSSGTDPNAGGSSGSTGASGTTGTTSGSGTSGGSTDPNAGTSGGSSSPGLGGSTGQTFGGGGIIGVESTSPKLAILVWKKKTHFNEWEFWYDPNADLVTVSSGGSVGSPIGSGGINSTGSASPSQFNQPPGGPNQNPNSSTPPTSSTPQQQQQQ